MASSLLAAAASAAAPVPAAPAGCTVCKEKRTYLIVHSSPGADGSPFEAAAKTHAKEIEANALPPYVTNIRKFDKNCDKTFVKYAESGFELNDLLTSYTDIVHIAYFGHSSTHALFMGFDLPTPGKTASAQMTNDFLYSKDKFTNYIQDIEEMSKLPYDPFATPPRADPDRMFFLYNIDRLDTSNIDRECTIYLFSCRTGLESEYEAKAVHPDNMLGSRCIAEQFANKFFVTVYAYTATSIFTEVKEKGHGYVDTVDSDIRRVVDSSGDVWLIPNRRKAPYFVAFPVNPYIPPIPSIKI